jgi:hypothetical protein
LPLETEELPMKTIATNTGKVLCCNKGVKNVNVDKNAITQTGSIPAAEVSGQEDRQPRYTSNSYQKILDYHVSEILLTTIIIGVVLLLRLHH